MRSKKEAFREAFESHSDELFRHAFLRLSNRERALELVQECFLKAWSYAKGDEIREMRAFLYRILRNLIIDEYRKARVYSLDEMLEGDDGGEIESKLPRDAADAMESAMDRFDAKRALALLPRLPDMYREVITMRYIESLELREIAALTHETENVVSVRIHRGLKKLHALLEAEY